MAYGELQLLPAEFQRFSWREFFLALDGYYDNWVRRQLEPLRVVAYTTYTTAFKGSRRKPKGIEQFWPLPTDKGVDVKEMTAAFEKAREKLNKQKNNSDGGKAEINN